MKLFNVDLNQEFDVKHTRFLAYWGVVCAFWCFAGMEFEEMGITKNGFTSDKKKEARCMVSLILHAN